MRTKNEINEVLAEADSEDDRWPSMSYEDGVRAALQWVTGDTPDDPFAEN